MSLYFNERGSSSKARYYLGFGGSHTQQWRGGWDRVVSESGKVLSEELPPKLTVG